MREPRDREPPESVVRRVTEPGERIVWCGRPDREALTSEARRMASGPRMVGRLLRFGFIALVLLLGVSYLNGSDPQDTLWLLVAALRAQPLQALMAATALVAFPAFILWLHRRSARSFIRRAEGLTYAITDRRLLIVLDDEIEDELSPEEVRSPSLKERVAGFDDVILRRSSGGSSRGESLAARERRTVGFKALPDAEGILHLIQEWRDAHLTASERQVEDFLADHVSPSSTSSGVEGAEPGTGGPGYLEATPEGGAVAGDAPDPGDDEKRITGGRHGLAVTIPVEWDAKVRRRGQPFGRVTLDLVRWKDRSELADWNAVQVDGPFGTVVEVHVDAVSEPTLEYEKTLNSTLGGMMVGEVVESRPDLRRGRFQGWSVTRRHESLADPSKPELDQPGFTRTTLLHDGVIQLVFQSRWPAGTESMARVVGRIEETVSAQSQGVTPDTVGPSPVATALGAVGALLTFGRVVVGLFFFGIGVWAGYDQTQRADAYDAALATLVEASADGLPTLPADEVVEEHDDRLAYLQGPLEAPIVSDTLTGLSVDTWRLVRTVELYQWEETETSDAKPYPDEVFISGDLRLGAWRLPPLTWGRPEREPVPDSILLAAATSSPRWSVSDGYLYDAQIPDVRVRYTYHPVPRDTYSLIGIPSDGEIDLDGALMEVSPLRRGNVPADAIVSSVAGTTRGVSLLWVAYSWIGLMLLIRPVTKRLELFRFLTDAPFPKRFAMTAGVAALVVLALALWFY